MHVTYNAVNYIHILGTPISNVEALSSQNTMCATIHVRVHVPVLSSGVVKATSALCVVEECVETTLKAVECPF